MFLPRKTLHIDATFQLACAAPCLSCFRSRCSVHGVALTRAAPVTPPLLQDSVFEFEKKRNVPVKYDRELWQNTGASLLTPRATRMSRAVPLLARSA